MSKRFTTTRRTVLQGLPLIAGAAISPISTGRLHAQQGNLGKQDRIHFAAIGVGGRGTAIASHAKAFGDVVAVCDVDRQHAQRAREQLGGKAQICHDFRAVLERDDVHAVTIGTPDHWHVPIAIAACRAGKDVYCEKPMTLTIEEGRRMCDVCRKTGSVVQIGTQQRSDPSFIKAIALIRDGRIGELKRASCSIGGAPTSPAIPRVAAPANLDWNLWLGPAPEAPFRYLAGDNGETQSWSRAHYEFRWWYEYSGGKLTDWGAHHVDIATWALDKTNSGPTLVVPKMVEHPVQFKDGYPTDDSQYNTATRFLINATFADGKEIEIRHDRGNGILFEGTEGRIFVNRGRLSGKAVDELKSKPLPSTALEAVYKNRPLVNHFRNFFEAAAKRNEKPLGDPQ